MRRPTVEIGEEEMMLLLQADLDRAGTVEAWAECVGDWVFSSLDSTTSRDLSQVVTVYSQLEEEEKPQFLTALLRATKAAFESCRDAKEKRVIIRPLLLRELKAHMELWERLTVEEVPKELSALSYEIYAFAGELGNEYAPADLDLASFNVLIQYGEPDREFLLRALNGLSDSEKRVLIKEAKNYKLNLE